MSHIKYKSSVLCSTQHTKHTNSASLDVAHMSDGAFHAAEVSFWSLCVMPLMLWNVVACQRTTLPTLVATRSCGL